ncbi:EAL domain-containing protein [Nitrosomonas sp.]|uniref:EAL domain-containing protein n=1 Tax=Nitrosomonas sp. TaxID=42353 RepID=UPI001D75948E|nr:EAL domain-containing protein [Nitrosomonas sp.]MBX3616766.1 EAL domain-containing protein [Nitrosomonas sp.]
MIQWSQKIYRGTFLLRVFLLLSGVGALSYFDTLERIDAVFYDRLSAVRHDAPDNHIVIVAIDENSLRILGRWPWSRSVHAELINRLQSVGSRVIALDLLFAEPQESDFYADELLASAMAHHGPVILPVAPAESGFEHVFLVEPLSIFRKHAILGHADIELDSDGVARRIFLKAGIDQSSWPALGLAIADYAKTRSATDSHQSLSDYGITAAGRWVRTQEMLIPYAGPPGSFQQLSYIQVLSDDQVLAGLKDKIVLIGMTATGLGTRFATPVSPINRQPMSGIEWHANVVNMLLHDRAITPFPNLVASIISAAWVLMILLVAGVYLRDISVLSLLAMLMLGLLLVWLSLSHLCIWFPPAAAMLGTISIYPLLNWKRINEFMHSLFETKVQSSAALESVGDGVITTDAHDHIIYMNKGAEKILRMPLNVVQGVLLTKLMRLSRMHDSALVESDDFELPLPAPDASSMQCYIKTSDNDKRAVRITRHALRDEHDTLIGYVVALADITDTVELTKQIAYQASYDSLTKLPNRVLLVARFEELAAAPVNHMITVFFVALDGFKKVNDALGHRAGDELLKMVSRRLVDTAGSDAIVARWGGDEFVLLFNSLNKKENAFQMAQRILEAIRQKFHLLDQDIFVTVSIGISFFPDNGVNCEEVLERASTAIHRVKNEGGNNFGSYSTESSVAWTRDRLVLEKELRTALNGDELLVLYQPIVDVYQRRIVRLEALVRWPHPSRGELSPSEFVPLAESVGLMGQLGEKVLRTACLDVQQLLLAGRAIHVSVNVHPHQLLHGNFVHTLSQVLIETKFPPASLILEVTESAVVCDLGRASEILTRIRALGVLIALDDFGTGYSSLTLLRELPIDILKIDKSFIRALDQNLNDLTIVQAIIGLGGNLGLAIVAEGVESERQVRILLDNHCYLQQGYYFSRPVPFDAMMQLLSEADQPNPVSIERLCGLLEVKQ